MLKSILRHWRGSSQGATARFMLPPAVFEIAPGFATGVGLEGSRRRGRQVSKVSLHPLGSAVLQPHLSHANITGGEEFARATSSLIAAIGNGDGRFGLVLPDGAVRVGLISFETLPESPEEVESLVRWRMRERLPFNPEDARLSYQVLSKAAGQIEILAIAMRNTVIEEYESAFAALGAKSSLILPATAALLPLLPDSAAVQVLIHICGNWLTVVVLDGAVPCAWRTRELDPQDASHYEREIALESARVAASAGERIQGELGRVWLCVRPPAAPSLLEAIAETLGHEVTMLRPPPDLGSRLSASDRECFEQFGATVAGLIANEN
jgi:hypothetical protein